MSKQPHAARPPVIRSRPEDFRVEEILREPPCGSGPYLWVQVEKTDTNTATVARDLAGVLGVDPNAVRWAGRKDRHAVTRQWFSIATPGDLPEDVEIEGVEICEVTRHDERLRLGEISGNRFQIVVRGVDEEAFATAKQNLDGLIAQGMPNRFGAQRFGRDGENVAQGLELLRGERPLRDKRRDMLMISALQAEVFNRVLARREEVGVGIGEVVAGDLAIEHGDGIIFDVVDPSDERIARRVKNFILSPTGPIFGTKMRRPRGAQARLEKEVLSSYDLPEAHSLKLPRKLRVPGTRRALRMPLPAASLTDLGDESIEVCFDLFSGGYATVLLEDLFPGLQDAQQKQK